MIDTAPNNTIDQNNSATTSMDKRTTTIANDGTPSSFLHTKFQIGSCHGRTDFGCFERVFHSSDMRPNGKEAREFIEKKVLKSYLLAGKNIIGENGKPWDASTSAGSTISGMKKASWDQDRFDDRYYAHVLARDRIAAREKRIELIRSGIDPDRDMNIIGPKWNLSKAIDEKLIKPLSASLSPNNNAPSAPPVLDKSKKLLSHHPVPSLIERETVYQAEIRAEKRAEREKRLMEEEMKRKWDEIKEEERLDYRSPTQELLTQSEKKRYSLEEKLRMRHDIAKQVEDEYGRDALHLNQLNNDDILSKNGNHKADWAKTGKLSLEAYRSHTAPPSRSFYSPAAPLPPPSSVHRSHSSNNTSFSSTAIPQKQTLKHVSLGPNNVLSSHTERNRSHSPVRPYSIRFHSGIYSYHHDAAVAEQLPHDARLALQQAAHRGEEGGYWSCCGALRLNASGCAYRKIESKERVMEIGSSKSEKSWRNILRKEKKAKKEELLIQQLSQNGSPDATPRIGYDVINDDHGGVVRRLDHTGVCLPSNQIIGEGSLDESDDECDASEKIDGFTWTCCLRRGKNARGCKSTVITKENRWQLE